MPAVFNYLIFSEEKQGCQKVFLQDRIGLSAFLYLDGLFIPAFTTVIQ